MNAKERKLIAALLRLASEEFSNNGCNDLDAKLFTKAGFTKADRKALMSEYKIAEYGKDDDEEDDHTDIADLGDWCLMDFMADRLEKEA